MRLRNEGCNAAADYKENEISDEVTDLKTIFRIFKSDINAIVKHFFVLAIVLAVAALPSLYAWINIYATWNPYVNTGSVPVALASRDLGIEGDDGNHIDDAAATIDEFKDNEKIKYIPVDSAKEAIDGVSAGKYYAAIIFEDGFTYAMNHYEEAIGDTKPRITYCSNVKKNAIAPKITDTAADNMLRDINFAYVKAMMTKYFGDAQELVAEIDTDDAASRAVSQLRGTQNSLRDYSAAIGQIVEAGEPLSESLSNSRENLATGRVQARSDIDKADANITEAQVTLRDISRKVDQKSSAAEDSIDNLDSTINKLQKPMSEEEKKKLVKEANTKADTAITDLTELRAMIPQDSESETVKNALTHIDAMIVTLQHVKNLTATVPSSGDVISGMAGDLKHTQKMMRGEVRPELETMIHEFEDALERAKPLLDSAGTTLDDLDTVMAGSAVVMDESGAALTELQGTLNTLSERLDDVIGKVQAIRRTDDSIVNGLSEESAAKYSEFITDLVQVETEDLYKPVSYGAAMAPFYTTIALWVGAVMLVTLMDTNVKRKKYPGASEAQCFFGRYLVFFLVGQLQAAIVVLGDIFLLHVEPVHPWLFWLSAAITDMIFVMLIYALTLAFGDIGKAVVVVIMMLQISGSSGSYPIEILPGIYGKIFKFFPFPYAIDAMREAMFGMYAQHFELYLSQLAIFFICAIIIGLLVRKPFIGMKKFVRHKMDETEVL